MGKIVLRQHFIEMGVRGLNTAVLNRNNHGPAPAVTGLGSGATHDPLISPQTPRDSEPCFQDSIQESTTIT